MDYEGQMVALTIFTSFVKSKTVRLFNPGQQKSPSIPGRRSEFASIQFLVLHHRPELTTKTIIPCSRAAFENSRKTISDWSAVFSQPPLIPALEANG